MGALTRVLCLAQLHVDDDKVVDAMVVGMLKPKTSGSACSVDTCQYRVRLCHFSTQPYVCLCSARTQPFVCLSSLHACNAWGNACDFATNDADLEVMQRLSDGDADGAASTRGRSGKEKRLIRLVDFVPAFATLHFSSADSSTPKGDAGQGLHVGGTQRLAAAVLVFELPREWTWVSALPATSAQTSCGGVGGAVPRAFAGTMRDTGGRWVEQSARMGAVISLESLIGPSAVWMGEYKVDRQSGEKLSQVLHILGTSTAQVLKALDGEHLARMIDLQLGVVHGAWIRPRMAQSEVWSLSLAKRSGSV